MGARGMQISPLEPETGRLRVSACVNVNMLFVMRFGYFITL